MELNDKLIEQNRYNYSSKEKLNSSFGITSNLGSHAYPAYLQAPYVKYESLIAELAGQNKNLKQLDLCCGDGVHSFTAASYGANVIALDYAENSILIAKKRSIELNLDVDFRTCDVEDLPFEDNSFDLITCIGSLSYLNQEVFLSEVKRVLKPGGVFICVDSFNHNIFYRLNRYYHYLNNRRSFSTLKRMPNIKLLQKIDKLFKEIKVSYFGTFVFICPFLKIFFDDNKVAKIVSKMDYLFPMLNKFAFKVVIRVEK
ncbi:class I SAM-dependent methyltransferase [Sandaracinomonas limnophila]|uniref:Class I SAM-dependent methyltransferase n=1 Tax=Sandaracinomonas limnophila TaxID=1862386 RepID=A0A437PTJ6_9BACT|nr:class I SAM-dependent methyltransferase [Sandaracinomonas limnophila]RVU25595.1 class I SAM-dependent methyltransferase [Sandaracinomonas limnophila]